MGQYFCYEGLLFLFAAVATRAERDAERGSSEAKDFLQELRTLEVSTPSVRKVQRGATPRWEFNETPAAQRMIRRRLDEQRG